MTDIILEILRTNLIENSFRNTRGKIGRVTRFRAETDQASRWMAYALLEVEKGFHRISGWRELPALARSLERPATSVRPAGAATSLRPTLRRRPSRPVVDVTRES